MHRFFLSPHQITPEHVVFPAAQARQIRVVLRMAVGDSVTVLDNTGALYEVRLAHVERDHVIGNIVGKKHAPGEPKVVLTLYQSFLKRDKFETVLQKGTEVGVSRFVPLVTQRTLVQATEMKQNKAARWETILQEAAEQSERGRIPELAKPVMLKTAVSQFNNFDLTLLCYARVEGVGVQVAVSQRPTAKTVALLIGPEGGFSEEEVAQCSKAGAQIVTLGPRILRTETAAIVAAALTLHELGQMTIDN